MCQSQVMFLTSGFDLCYKKTDNYVSILLMLYISGDKRESQR